MIQLLSLPLLVLEADSNPPLLNVLKQIINPLHWNFVTFPEAVLESISKIFHLIIATSCHDNQFVTMWYQ